MPTPRELAHADTLARILDLGRAQLAHTTPQHLSLRAIARELGVSSSAVYRYVPSRDALLTRLIVAAYDALGEAVEGAVHDTTGHRVRWRAACDAVRTWAHAHPHEWALVYGSPVPDYAAPPETVPAAGRAAAVLVGIAVEAGARAGGPPPGPPLSGQLAATADQFAAELDPVTMGALMDAWTHLFGTVTLERFGHLVGTVDPADAYWDHLVQAYADRLQIGD